MAPTYKLIYFNAKGRAEIARIMFAYGGIEYEDVRLEREQWLEMKSKMPLGQLPVLEVDGEMICQSGAIDRFVAKRTGLMGKSDLDEARINVALGSFEDFMKPVPAILHEEDADRKKALLAKFMEAVPAETAKLESLVKGPYFIGDQMTVADISLSACISFAAMLGANIKLADYPKLKAITEKVNAHPKIAEWVAKRPVTER